MVLTAAVLNDILGFVKKLIWDLKLKCW